MIITVLLSALIILSTTIILRLMYIQHAKNERTIEQCIAQLKDHQVSSIEVTQKHFAGPIYCQIK